LGEVTPTEKREIKEASNSNASRVPDSIWIHSILGVTPKRRAIWDGRTRTNSGPERRNTAERVGG